jgi:hypothetical protein
LQSNFACQWSLKYQPHTHNLTNSLLSVSTDFHGTLTTYASIPNLPVILHQRYMSNFIRTLRDNGCNSAYVPTASIYSST